MEEVKIKNKENRRLMPRSPFLNLDQMEKEMEEMFGSWWWRYPDRFGFGWPRRRWTMEAHEFLKPLIDIYEEKDDLVIKAEVPGIKKDEIEIKLVDHCLKIKGQKKRDHESKEGGYYWSERAFGTFERSIDIPLEIVSEKISASFCDGVLEVRLPKTGASRHKELKIDVA